MQNYLSSNQPATTNYKETIPIYNTLGSSTLDSYFSNKSRNTYEEYTFSFDNDIPRSPNPTDSNDEISNFNSGKAYPLSNSKNGLHDDGPLYRGQQTPGSSRRYSEEQMFSPYQPGGDQSNDQALKDSESVSTHESSISQEDDRYLETSLKSHPVSAGLPNLGNTCYMNSVLQCLFNTEKLCEALEKNKDYIEKSAAPITNRFMEAISAAFSRQSSMSGPLKAFKKALEKVAPIFKGYSQNDAHELFRLLIEKIHDELNTAPKKSGSYVEFTPKDNKKIHDIAEEWKQYSKDRDDSLMTSLFGGILLTEVKCEHCGHVSYTFEDALDLSLNVANLKGEEEEDSDDEDSMKSLRKCLRDFATPEFVDGYACDKCKRRDSSYKRTTVWKQPEVLVVQLKRFVYDLYGNRKAVKNAVSFPLENMTLDEITHEDSNERKQKYKLYGIVNHYGSLNFGHYTAFVYNDEQECWYQYNDDQVTRIDEADMEEFAEGSSEPYILFYKKI